MNKIVLVDDIVEFEDKNNSLKVELIPKNDLFDVDTLKIDILKDSKIDINIKHLNISKLNIEINTLENVKATIYEFKEGIKVKVKYHYNISFDAKLDVYKFYDIDSIREFVRIDLNGENSTINYNFKTISSNTQKYDLTIYHNKPKTISSIINNGVNILDGNLTFNVSSFVPNGIIKCDVTQKSRIINLTHNKCSISPNLYIDEYNVNASHSAYIGKFKSDELFYLMSRGIDEENAEYLLIKGILINNMGILVDKINDACEKFWR